MIFSKNSRKAPHLLSLLVAFAVAVGMWYVVSVRDRLEVQLEVGIEYNGRRKKLMKIFICGKQG